MKTNFDISLPTIPGKNIKFKIQDIKQTAFGSQKARFNQNKMNLTKKFIESFNNFHQPLENKYEEQTDAESKSNSRVTIKKQVKQEVSFRHLVPQQRKYLLSVYETYKNHQPLIYNGQAKGNGYTFNKVPRQKSSKLQNLQANQDQQKKFVTDNYYFTSSLIRRPIQQVKKVVKKEKPSAVFKTQTRNIVYGRIYSSQVPGPGYYIKNQHHKQKSRKRVQSEIHKSQNQMDFKKLKQVISNIVVSQQPSQDYNQEAIKESKLQHMFIIDDRDRFGQQKYPIAPKINVPGPGTYQISDGIQDKAKKVIVVQQQRKLLKQWFNN